MFVYQERARGEDTIRSGNLISSSSAKGGSRPKRGKGGILTARGLEACLCGCGRAVPKSRNRNKVKKRFFADQCRRKYEGYTRQVGRQVLDSGILVEAAERAIERAKMLPERKKRQEKVDLDAMTPKQRLVVLCRAAKRMGVLRQTKEVRRETRD